MKKFTPFALVFLLLTSCSGLQNDSSEDIQALQNEIDELQNQIEAMESSQEEVSEEQTEQVADENTEEDDPDVVESYLVVTSPTDGVTYHAWEDDEPFTFTGQVSPNTEKIVVTAVYTLLEWDESVGLVTVEAKDVYTLQNYTPGDSSFTYRASQEWDNLGFGENEYYFTAYHLDGTQSTDTVSLSYEADGLGKPVVYLYPEVPMPVFVDVEPVGGVAVSIPELKDGWNVLAHPNGRLFNFDDLSYYSYLFWEGFAPSAPSSEEGFVVAKEDLNLFFSEKLEILGLNEQEISDFNEYWIPNMQNHPYAFIHFVEQDYLDTYAPLTVIPKPDTVIRVFFTFEGLDQTKQVTAQELTPVSRDGFTVTEWGGPMLLP